MTKYQDWIEQQSKEFKNIVHKSIVPKCFVNEDANGITLDELEALDDKHIFNQGPEGGDKK